jgi:hypothetical protein
MFNLLRKKLYKKFIIIMSLKIFGLIVYNITGYFDTSINILICTNFQKFLNIFSTISYCEISDKSNLGIIVGVGIGAACIGLACYQYKKLNDEFFNCKDNTFILKNRNLNLDEKLSNMEIINIQKDSKILNMENLISLKEKKVNDLEGLEIIKNKDISNLENLNIKKTEELDNLEKTKNNSDLTLENKKNQLDDKLHEFDKLKLKLDEKTESLNVKKMVLRKLQNKTYASELYEKKFNLKEKLEFEILKSQDLENKKNVIIKENLVNKEWLNDYIYFYLDKKIQFDFENKVYNSKNIGIVVDVLNKDNVKFYPLNSSIENYKDKMITMTIKDVVLNKDINVNYYFFSGFSYIMPNNFFFVLSLPIFFIDILDLDYNIIDFIDYINKYKINCNFDFKTSFYNERLEKYKKKKEFQLEILEGKK